MTPFATWLYAILRRIAVVAGSGILAYMAANWQGWVAQGTVGDEKAVTAWAVILLIIEAIQKGVRVSKA